MATPTAAIQIPTLTTVTSIGSDITIFTWYDEHPFICIRKALIYQVATVENGTSLNAGDLGIEAKPCWLGNNVYLDSQGSLNVSSADAAKYSINVDGELIYTYP